jgi:Undecaprenyl-phosphate glucose phosphotransferase
VIPNYDRALAAGRLSADLLVIALSFLAAWFLRFHTPLIPRFAPIPPFLPYLALLVGVLLIWTAVLQVGDAGLIRGQRTFVEEIGTLIQAHAFGILLIFAIIFFIRPFTFSRVMMVLFWSLSTLGLVAERAAFRLMARALTRRGFGLRRILMVGSGELAEQVLRRFQRHPELGYRFVGLLTEEQTRPDTSLLGVPALGIYEDLGSLAVREKIDLVVVALPGAEQARLGDLLGGLGDAPVDVWVVPDFERHVRLRGGIAELDGLPLVSLQTSPLGGWNAVMKRCLDLGITSAGLVLLSPVMALIALGVRLTSHGPILYRQERMGLDGQRFQILKFRSMVVGAETSGARFASPRDPRITVLGRLLRRISLDELPQFFNILRGDMSLVGPRPERPVFIEDFRRHFPRYMLRHRVKAGMTGFAQVHGLRGNTSLEARLEHDLFYIENWSVWLDLKILLMTIPVVLRGKGAT